LAEPYTGYSCKGDCCVAGAVVPLWGANLFMTPGSANTDRPLAIALGVNLSMPEFVTLARAPSPHRRRHQDHLPQGCQYRRSQRGQLPGRCDQSACRRSPLAILGQRLDLSHTSGILHRSQVFHRGEAALMATTFAENRRW
jgi:hypothetical protein